MAEEHSGLLELTWTNKHLRLLAEHVSADKKVGAEWRYLLVSEDDVEAAHGSWSALNGFA